jgi:hypothetical protein
VARWHHVAGFLVGAKSDLKSPISPLPEQRFMMASTSETISIFKSHHYDPRFLPRTEGITI